MELTMTVDADGTRHIWAHLAGEDLAGRDDVTEMAESFIIGSGATPNEARADAVRELEAAVERLQGPAPLAGEHLSPAVGNERV